MNRGLAVVAACVTLSGCAAAGGVPKTSETPRRDLAARPSIAPSAPSGGSTAGPTSSDHASAATSTATPAAPPGGASPTGGGGAHQPDAPFHDFVTLTDPAGDAGLGAPAYADLRGVTLADNGVSLRATVALDGPVPSTAAATDTLGIGVDLYRPGTARESDYQLFADGEPDGWFAYLDTPRGFVRYPGTFAIAGNQLVFTVPLSSVGSPRTGRVSTFADWSRRSSGVTGNQSSNDYAPTLGTTSYSR